MRRLIWTCATLCLALVSCDTTEPEHGVGGPVTLDPPMFDTLPVNLGTTNVTTIGFAKDSLATVSFTATGPSGTTVSLSPTTSDPGSRGGDLRVSVTAPSGAALQTGTVTVTAHNGGIVTTTSFVARIQAPPAKSPLAFRVCNALAAHGIGSVRYQNDGEPWQVATEDARGLVQISATPRLAIAYEWAITAPSFFMSTTRVIYATRAELAEISCPETRGTKTFPIKALNASAYTASINGFKAPVSWYGIGAVTGALDLFATSTTDPRRAIVRPGVDVPDRDTIALDFADPEVVTLDSASLTVTSLGADTVAAGHEGNGADVLVLSPTTIHRVFKHSGPTGPTAKVPSYYFALPMSALGVSDMQALMVQAGNPPRGIVHWFRGATTKTLNMPPPMAGTEVNAGTNSVTIPSQAEYGDVAGARFRSAYISSGLGFSQSTWYIEVWVTKSYRGGTPAVWRFRAPAGISQFDDAPTATSAAMVAGGRASLVFGAPGTDGEALRWAANSAPFTGIPFPASRGLFGR